MRLPEDLKNGVCPQPVDKDRVVGIGCALIAVAVLAAGCMPDQSAALTMKRAELMEAELAFAYSCGYLHGQRAIMASAKMRGEPVLFESCARFTNTAIKHGFLVARKDR